MKLFVLGQSDPKHHSRWSTTTYVLAESKEQALLVAGYPESYPIYEMPINCPMVICEIDSADSVMERE